MPNNSNCSEISSAVYVSGYSIIAVLGLIINCFAMYFLCHLPQQRSPTTVYMKNLAFADLLLVFTLPLRIYGHALPNPSNTEIFSVCGIAGAILLLNMYGSIFLLTCISLDRCLAICYPLRSRRLRQGACWICAGVWIYNVVACSIILFMSNNKNNINNSNISNCLNGKPPYVTRKVATIPSLTIGFFFPALIITFSSVALLKAMKRSQVVQEGMINKVKIVRMLTANILIFLLCFLPYHTVLLLYQFETETCYLDKAYGITLLVACINTILDPFLYYFTSETMKNVVKEEIKVGKARFLELSELSVEKHKTNDSIGTRLK
ncbi:PREDICTED: lysophosphatidic acid receptor 6-like [Nanorana parkeri]|uniref:lysophosphatidic acid receptor 6-like n=1 Tax=Nanorana parkeri TaxID=125878 RepID=UPI00085433D3|nr:PREDICTED: lysophosphatidic acid receptor 6-like [Nanorana parkeri]